MIVRIVLLAFLARKVSSVIEKVSDHLILGCRCGSSCSIAEKGSLQFELLIAILQWRVWGAERCTSLNGAVCGLILVAVVRTVGPSLGVLSISRSWRFRCVIRRTPNAIVRLSSAPSLFCSYPESMPVVKHKWYSGLYWISRDCT